MDKKYRVSFYEMENGTFPAEEYINSLDVKVAAKIYRIFGMLEVNGPKLREPYSKHLTDGIFEVRVKHVTGLARVLYFFYVDNQIIATHGFNKKTQKTPQGEIKKAKAYRKTYLSREVNSNENT